MTYIKTKFRPGSRFFVENYDAATHVQQTQLMSLKSIYKAITYSLIDGVGLVELHIDIATICE